jgi:hypothetical protein
VRGEIKSRQREFANENAETWDTKVYLTCQSEQLSPGLPRVRIGSVPNPWPGERTSVRRQTGFKPPSGTPPGKRWPVTATLHHKVQKFGSDPRRIPPFGSPHGRDAFSGDRAKNFLDIIFNGMMMLKYLVTVRKPACAPLAARLSPLPVPGRQRGPGQRIPGQGGQPCFTLQFQWP